MMVGCMGSPGKGEHWYAIRVLVGNLEELGFVRLKKAVKREFGEGMTSEEAPVGESRSLGEASIHIQILQGQIRTLRDALGSRYGKRIDGPSVMIPWMVQHAARIINRFRVGKDGRTAHQRVKGRGFQQETVQFGECAWCLKPKLVGKNKADVRWEGGGGLARNQRQVRITLHRDRPRSNQGEECETKGHTKEKMERGAVGQSQRRAVGTSAREGGNRGDITRCDATSTHRSESSEGGTTVGTGQEEAEDLKKGCGKVGDDARMPGMRRSQQGISRAGTDRGVQTEDGRRNDRQGAPRLTTTARGLWRRLGNWCLRQNGEPR